MRRRTDRAPDLYRSLRLWSRLCAFHLLVWLWCLSAADAAPLDAPTPPTPTPSPMPSPEKTSGKAKAPGETKTRLIPLPIYATLPNEGSTYGFMPVFLIVEQGSERTQSIIAPSISWNRIIQWTHTFRWFYYPSPTKTITLIPSISLNVNRGVTAEYSEITRVPGDVTTEAFFHARRSLFPRFFGLGPESREENESSYTAINGDLGGRIGFNASSHFNMGLKAFAQRQLVERKNVSFLPLATETFPNTPGFNGATAITEGASLRYDTRRLRDYSTQGFFSELFGGYSHGLEGTDGFGRIQAESRFLWEETSFINGGARIFWGQVLGSNIPFFFQNTLGGSYYLRGFTENRFIDKGAWDAEIEQRITLFKTHIYGVTTDWRLDPFVGVGQVYGNSDEFFKRPRFVGGLGFRAFVKPNVLGRVDTAWGGEGLKIYVELGYPF